MTKSTKLDWNELEVPFIPAFDLLGPTEEEIAIIATTLSFINTPPENKWKKRARDEATLPLSKYQRS